MTQTTTLKIKARVRQSAVWISRLEDFEVIDGDPVPASAVVDDPNLTLYCLDDTGRRAIFVETPGGVNLSEKPFVYQTQYELAERLVAVPFHELHELAERLPTPTDDVVVLYSVGRCGSTLIYRALTSLDATSGYSEPDLLTNVIGMRPPDGCRDDELSALLKSCIRLLRVPREWHGAPPETWVLKPRSYSIEIADLIDRAVPDAKALFLYRNARDWVRSSLRAFGQEEVDLSTLSADDALLWLRLSPLLIEYMSQLARGELSLTERVAISWLSAMRRVLDLRDLGVTMPAIRYEDIVRDRDWALRAILECCGLPTSRPLDTARRVFDSDSQADTTLAREELAKRDQIDRPSANNAEIGALLAERPVIRHHDFVLPGTCEIDLHLAPSPRALSR